MFSIYLHLRGALVQLLMQTVDLHPFINYYFWNVLGKIFVTCSDMIWHNCSRVELLHKLKSGDKFLYILPKPTLEYHVYQLYVITLSGNSTFIQVQSSN